MKEKIVKIIGDKLESLGIWVDDAYLEEEEGQTYLRIVLDKDEIIPLNTVVMATRIINPLLDKEEDLVKGSYILDVYAKAKGGN